MKADTIEFKIVEGDKSVQVLEINIEPGRTVIADSSALIYVDEEIDINVQEESGAEPKPEPIIEPEPEPEEEEEEVFYEEEQDIDKPLIFKVFGALRKTLTSTSQTEQEDDFPEIPDDFEEEEPEPEEEAPYFQVTHFSNNSDYIRSLAFASSRLGKIFDINLKDTYNQELVIQKGAFICAAKGTKLIHFLDTEVKMNEDDDESFVFEKIEGKGLAFLNAAGKIIPKKLNESAFRVNLANIVAYESSLDLQVYSLQRLPSLYGSSDNCLVILSGTGKVWLQSSTPQHLAQNLIPYLPKPTVSEAEEIEQESHQVEEEDFGDFDMNAPIEVLDEEVFAMEEEQEEEAPEPEPEPEEEEQEEEAPEAEPEEEEPELDIPEDPSPEELAQFMKDMGIED